MEFSIEEKLELVKHMCNNDVSYMKNFNYIYPFTIENISGYLPCFDFDGKSLLTVGSSCDQALNAILCGAKDITVFDICPFVKEYYYLKKAAIMTLTIDEYLTFLGSRVLGFRKDNPFDLDIYAKISRNLVNIDEVKYFWDEIFMHYNGVVIRELLFSTDRQRGKHLKMMNKYLSSDEDYMALRNKLTDTQINFEYGDVFSTPISGKYDNILLSNIATYNDLDKMLGLFNKMVELLNDDGKMLLAYLYETTIYDDDYMEGEPEIYNIPKVLQTFPEDIKFSSFVGVRGLTFRADRLRDSVITYKKVKKL